MVAQTIEIKPALKAELSALLDSLHLAPATTAPSTSSKPFGRARFDDIGNFDASDFPKRTVGKCFLQLGDVTPHNINQIKKINSYSKPVFQSNNDEAIQFYKKFGFEVIDRVDNYYKRITPDDAFLLEKVVNNGTKSATVSNTANCGDIMAE
uniref:N-acetyltransferase domain-containing protein n=1 Tax=Panagrellus redivivus TaxID=6233 RepID=A0A7E4V7F0_PANRE